MLSQPLHPAPLHFGPDIQAKQHTITAAMASTCSTNHQRTDQGDQAPAPSALDLLELLRMGLATLYSTAWMRRSSCWATGRSLLGHWPWVASLLVLSRLVLLG
jgi:hypothetical protein